MELKADGILAELQDQINVNLMVMRE